MLEGAEHDWQDVCAVQRDSRVPLLRGHRNLNFWLWEGGGGPEALQGNVPCMILHVTMFRGCPVAGTEVWLLWKRVESLFWTKLTYKFGGDPGLGLGAV